MASAKQCDRCGAYYPYLVMPGDFEKAEVERPKFEAKSLNWDEPWRGSVSYDLCPKCQKELDELLNKFFKE